jgi:uncharacterized protein YukE
MAEPLTIPGDPGGLQTLASQLRGAGDDVLSVRERVATNGLQGAWNGQASDAFRATLHSLPSELDKIVDAFGESASAIGSFAARLEELQQAAAWQNRQLALAEEELHSARTREASEKANVTASQRAHDTATDPVTKSTAARALSSSQGLLRQAASDVDDAASHIGALAGGGESLMGEYHDAVNAATRVLSAARHSAGRSWTAWAGHFAHDVLRHAEHFVGTAFHAARDAAEGALKEFNEHWDGIRKLLSDATMVVGVIAMAALVVGTGGGALVIIAGVTLGLAEATMAGDEIEAAQGNENDSRRLAGDGLDVGLSLLGFGAAAKAADEAAELAPSAARAAEDAKQGIEDSRGPIQTRATNALADRFAPGLRQKIGDMGRASKGRLTLANAWVNQQVHNEFHDLIDKRAGVREEKPSGTDRYLDKATDGPTSLIVPLTLDALLL